jgi:4-hydroxymandelate oxidase
MSQHLSARREFLRFLGASPLAALAEEPTAKDALSVLDFEPLAQKALPPAHWGYMSSGVDDDFTVRANREAMGHYQIRARRLVGVAKPELSFELFDEVWDLPIYFSAVSAQRAFHPDGELGTARAARAKKVVQMLSTVSSTSVEDVTKALGEPPWYQLYMPATWDETEKLVRRVEAAGCQVLAWTIDTLGGTQRRDRRPSRANRHPQLPDLPCGRTGRQPRHFPQPRQADVGRPLR